MAITQIQPAAAPVRRFVSPSQPVQVVGENSATQLARALSPLSPTLTSLFSHVEDKVDQTQVDKARAQRLQTALNYQDAIKKGIITPDQSPIFRKAWQEQDGRVAADQYNSDLLIALSTGPFAQSTDHKETEGLLNTFRSNWMSQNGINSGNLDFMDGFAKQAQAYEANARDHQASVVGQRVVDQTRNNTYHEVMGVFDDAASRDLPASSTADGINVITQRGILVGMDPKDVNRLVLDATIAKALETHSIEPFLVLDQVKTGTGFLGRTKEALQAKEEIQNNISATLIALDNHAHQKEQWQRDGIELASSAAVFSAVFNNQVNGQATTLESVAPQIRELAKVDPMKAHELEQIVIESGKPRPSYDDSNVRQQLTVDLFENKITESQIVSAYTSHLITVDTAKDLTDRLHAHLRENISDTRYANEQDRVNRPKDIIQIPAFANAAAGIKKAFGDDPFGLQKMDPSTTDRMNDALSSFYISAQQWRDATPNATMEDFLRKASELRKGILELYPVVGPDGINLTDKPTVSEAPLKVIGPVTTLVTPQSPTGAPQRYFGSAEEWTTALSEYRTKPAESKLGGIITKLGLTDPAAISSFLQTQNTLY